MFNDLEAHKLIGAGGTTAVTGWQRPSDWLPMPDILETEEKFVGLFAVHDLPENFIALYFEGDYTVDWGDGNIEDFSSGDKAQHSYAWNNVPSNTLTTDGYRQVLVTVTPQAGQNLSIMDLTVRHDTTYIQSESSLPWLDIAVSMPNASSGGSLRFCGYQFGINYSGYLYEAQRIRIIHAGGMSDFTECFYNFTSLRKVEILNSPSADTFYYLFDYCTSLTDVVLSDTSSVTNTSYMFSGCYSLTSVPLFDTSSVTNMDSMFNGCYALASVPLFDTSSVTNMVYMFTNCHSLTSVPLFDTSSVETMASMFVGCHSLASVPLFDTSSVIDISYMFSYCIALTSIPLFNFSSAIITSNPFFVCSSLQKAAVSGIQRSISYRGCNLGRQAIIDIFNEIGEFAGENIDLTFNYGAMDLTEQDIEIATNKGWTVSY